MDEHVLPAEAVAAVKRKRQIYAPEVIEKAVTESRFHGGPVATANLNKNRPVAERVPEETVRCWLSRWKKEGAFWDEPKKRGRKNLTEKLPDNVQQEWIKQVQSVRAKGDAVTGRVAAALGRGVLAEMAPSLLERHGVEARDATGLAVGSHTG